MINMMYFTLHIFYHNKKLIYKIKGYGLNMFEVLLTLQFRIIFLAIISFWFFSEIPEPLV